MPLINPSSKLSNVIMEEPTIVALLNRFGIALGVGDKTVAQACAEHQIDPHFFTTLLNTFSNEEYFPEHTLSKFDTRLIVDYMSKTNAYYQMAQLPTIERHFDLLITRSAGEKNNLELIRQFFLEVKTELLERINHDRQEWFPQLLNGSQTPLNGSDNGDDSIETKIDDLLHMFVIHLNGKYDLNLGQAVLLTIFALRNDIKMNNRIRNKMLKPACHAPV